MTDAVEAVGQDVQQEPPDELVRGKPHDAFSPGAAIVLVGERHLVVVDGDEPRIGDRGAMRVAGEIGQYALGPAERRLGVDDEGAIAKRAHAPGEGVGVCERSEIAEEAEFAALECRRQAVEEQPAEGLRQRVDGQEEVRLAGIQRRPSRATPPPGTRQWTWG
jgi:hypothetical protein